LPSTGGLVVDSITTSLGGAAGHRSLRTHLRGKKIMKIRMLRRADALAVNELLSQLGYPQDSQAATASRLHTWVEDPSSAAYVAERIPRPDRHVLSVPARPRQHGPGTLNRSRGRTGAKCATAGFQRTPLPQAPAAAAITWLAAAVNAQPRQHPRPRGRDGPRRRAVAAQLTGARDSETIS
jgi:hypothetical protein